MLFRDTENPAENWFLAPGFLRLSGWRSAIRKTVPFRTPGFGPCAKRVGRPRAPALRARAGGGLRLLPVWIVRAAVGQVDERVFAPKGHNIGAGRRRLKRRVEANEAAPRGAKGFRNP